VTVYYGGAAHRVQSIHEPNAVTTADLGASLAIVDVDGDGVGDLVAGAPGEPGPSGIPDGVTFTYYSTGGMATTEDRLEEAGARFGAAAAGSDGDVELLTGAPGESNGGGVLLLTPRTGATTPLACPSPAICGPAGKFGASVKVADVDGDLSDDVLVCAPGYDSGKGALVVYGTTKGSPGPWVIEPGTTGFCATLR
jgi:hypothetical protein